MVLYCCDCLCFNYLKFFEFCMCMFVGGMLRWVWECVFGGYVWGVNGLICVVVVRVDGV